MPRLTRTAKFADLRAQLANDREEKIESNDLSSYQDRFNNVQDTLNISNVEIQEEQPQTENNDFVWKPEEGSAFYQDENPVNIWNQPTEEETKTFEEVSIDEPVPSPFEEVVVAPTFEQPATPSYKQPVPPQQKIEEPVQTTSSYFDNFMSEPVEEEEIHTSDFSSYFESAISQPVQEKKTIEEIYSDVFDDVKDDSGEIVAAKERDTYLNQTLDGVYLYNEMKNQPTIDTIVDNSVNEVRHPETSQEVEERIVIEESKPEEISYVWNPPVEEEFLDADKLEDIPVDDEEFSNTVSMEITKIMDEISSAPIQEEPAPEIVEPVVEEEKIEEPEILETVQIDEVVAEEKPEEVVEIKNFSEIKDEPIKDTMSSTIPFIVAAEDEELEDDEDEDEDGSNTVLNVILIVLIVVLVAVLGLIVFYILKTKGIF